MDEDALKSSIDVSVLTGAARSVWTHAYAPYSEFRVSAAILDEFGRIHTGVNVENAAYPQGQCAEASAIGAMVTSGARHIRAIVIVGGSDEPCTPCGGCRQRLREFATDNVPVYLASMTDEHSPTTLGELLPRSFGPSHLKR